ncbi:hypothetical protein LCGC14_0994180 [marine sediment metagenome]|uniref:Uncharacterized protein n=1 Tax=marine sediment metagenome TaxID=412755 RepID=A0A0F9NRA4_9ZZZZ
MRLFIPMKVYRKLELLDGSGDIEIDVSSGVVGILLVYDDEAKAKDLHDEDVPILTMEATEE